MSREAPTNPVSFFSCLDIATSFTLEGMIRIGATHNRRVFSPNEVAELLPVVTRLSRRASHRATRRARSYGRLRESEPEWHILKSEMRDIIHGWSEQVGRLGAEPMELWTIAFRTEAGTEYWRYEPEDELEHPEDEV